MIELCWNHLDDTGLNMVIIQLIMERRLRTLPPNQFHLVPSYAVFWHPWDDGDDRAGDFFRLEDMPDANSIELAHNLPFLRGTWIEHDILARLLGYTEEEHAKARQAAAEFIARRKGPQFIHCVRDDDA